MKVLNMKTYKLTIALILSLFLATSCGHSDHDDSHGHTEAEGFQLLSGSTVVLDHKNNSKAVTTALELTYTGNEKTDEKEYSVKFYNHEGNLFVPGKGDGHNHSEGEEEKLKVMFLKDGKKVDADDVLKVELAHDAHAGGAHTDGDEWSFHLAPQKKGTEQIVILIMHGDHPDFESQPISVKVN